jgi:hypothetical protein
MKKQDRIKRAGYSPPADLLAIGASAAHIAGLRATTGKEVIQCLIVIRRVGWLARSGFSPLVR